WSGLARLEVGSSGGACTGSTTSDTYLAKIANIDRGSSFWPRPVDGARFGIPMLAMLAILAMLKRLLIALAVLVVLAAVLYFAAARILGSDLVRSTLEQQLSTALGQPVKIGAASAAIYPRVAVDLHSVAIGDPVSVNV